MFFFVLWFDFLFPPDIGLFPIPPSFSTWPAFLGPCACLDKVEFWTCFILIFVFFKATKGSSALLAQLLRYNGVSIGSLVYIGFSTLSAAFVLCLFLRFDWKKDPIWRKEASAVVLEPEKTFSSGWRESLLLYRMMEVQQFSLFLLVSNAIHPLVLTYTQSLIEDQQPSVVPYNAYLLSFATMMSCGCAVLPVLVTEKKKILFV